MKTYTVGTEILRSGFGVTVNNHPYRFLYPLSVWKSMPYDYKLLLSESAAFFYTRHFPLLSRCRIQYSFPPPVTQSLFLHGLLNCLAELTIDYPQFKRTTTQLVQTILNSGFSVKFKGIPKFLPSLSPSKVSGRKAAMLFSFGKDSLLTYALLKEIGIDPLLYFMAEPHSGYEVGNKRSLIHSFQIEHKAIVYMINNQLGLLRQKEGQWWGWDMLLTQYSLQLIPYIKHHRCGYYFLSNEQSTNELDIDKEGYLVNTTYEQSIDWVQHLNNLFRIFSLPTIVSSILDPIHEIVIMYILHRHYPAIAKYQLSCDNEHKSAQNKRWCESCDECARIFMFMLAIGADPKTIGFTGSMLGRNKKLFVIFSIVNKIHDVSKLTSGQAERLLSFHLAYLRGNRFGVMKLYESNILPRLKNKMPALVSRFIKIYPNSISHTEISNKLLHIYQKEIAAFKNEIAQLMYKD